MSDVREVSEYHEWHAGTLYGIGESIDDAMRELIEATGFPRIIRRILDAL